MVEVGSRAGHDVITTYYHHEIENSNALRADFKNEGDIRRMMKETSPDVVVHLASITDVDLCERDPELAKLINAKSTRVSS